MAKDDKGATKAKSKQLRKVMKKAADQAESANRTTAMKDRLARAAKSSELLSAVWSLPPQQRLLFHHGDQLTDVDPGSTPGFDGNEDAGQEFINISSSEIARYQRIMYANGVHGDHHRVLIVLQGMDASGKGGIVRHVFSQVDPMGIHYHGFGKPTAKELKHSFLWRVKKELPADGWISIFDRSHYEDLVMPQIQQTYNRDVVEERFEKVNEFERKLAGDGCAILKIFLVSSKDAQKRHFLKRLDDPTRFWKFDPSDLDARNRWDDYMAAWQEVFERTSTSWAPWYLVPADQRWYSRIVVSELLRTTMKNFNLTWPPLDVNREEALARLQ